MKSLLTLLLHCELNCELRCQWNVSSSSSSCGNSTNVSSTYLTHILGYSAADSTALSSNASMNRFATIGNSGDPIVASSAWSKNVSSNIKAGKVSLVNKYLVLVWWFVRSGFCPGSGVWRLPAERHQLALLWMGWPHQSWPSFLLFVCWSFSLVEQTLTNSSCTIWFYQQVEKGFQLASWPDDINGWL